MPLPPPPAEALTSPGSRSASAIAPPRRVVDRAEVARARSATPAARRSLRAAVLSPMASMALGGRADEGDAGVVAAPRRTGVLGQEAVAGVDRVGAGLPRRRDLRRCRGSSRPRAPGRSGRPRRPSRTWSAARVGLGVDGDGGDAHLAAVAHDAAGDLAAVGDEDLLEHRRAPRLLGPSWHAGGTASPRAAGPPQGDAVLSPAPAPQ